VLEAGSVRQEPRTPDKRIQTLTDAGVGFTSVGEGIDTRSATGRLMLGILGRFAEFERERIRERIHAGIARARREGKRLGR
jgi:DNA invertase Pin-like site-specific DNA recombinase